MVAKKLKIEGYGDIFLQVVDVKDPEGEDCTADGKPLIKSWIGEGKHQVFKTAEGVVVESSQVCKKFNINGKEIVTGKLPITKEVKKAKIKEIEGKEVVYKALDKKVYNVTTDCDALKQKVVTEGKTLTFPITFGTGYKGWLGVLTSWNGKLILFGCRGDIDKALEKYTEETIEISIEEPTQQEEFLEAVVM